MKTRSIVVFMALLAFLTILVDTEIAEDAVVNSTWPGGPVVIDGFTLDWQDVPAVHNKKTGTDCAVMNDENHLYVLLTLHDLNLSYFNYFGKGEEHTYYFGLEGSLRLDNEEYNYYDYRQFYLYANVNFDFNALFLKTGCGS